MIRKENKKDSEKKNFHQTMTSRVDGQTGTTTITIHIIISKITVDAEQTKSN